MTVSFGSVTIYEFTVAIGDCPFVTGGVPLRIDEMVGQRTLSFKEFESIRARLRKTPCELRMSAQDRYQQLRSQGYLPRELKAAAMKAKQNVADSLPSPTRSTVPVSMPKTCKRSPIRMPRTLARKLFETKGPIEISV